MSEFWINFLIIPRSDYLKRWENCSLLCKKVKSSIESQNVKFDEKISSGHNIKMWAKDGRKVKTYKILIYVSVNLRKVRNLWVNM